YPQALEEFREVTRAEPRWPHIEYLLGGVEAELGKFDAAESHLRRELSVHPSSFDANFVLGALLSSKRGTSRQSRSSRTPFAKSLVRTRRFTSWRGPIGRQGAAKKL